MSKISLKVIEEDDVFIFPSRELKKAPMNKKLSLNSWCIIKKISGKMVNGTIKVRVEAGEGPKGELPGNIFNLPAHIKVGILIPT